MTLTSTQKTGAGIAAALLVWVAIVNPATLVLALVVGGFVWWAIRTRRFETAGKFTTPEGDTFKPTHAISNLAIDVNTRRLWLRDEKNRRRVLEAQEVMGWSQHWTDERNGFGRVFHTRNHFRIRTRDVDQPTWIVPVSDYRTAQEWHDRLTAFFNP